MIYRRGVNAYGNKVTDPDWHKDPTKKPPAPAPSGEDQTSAYDYDLLDREISRDEPLQKGIRKQFDVMGHLTFQQAKDLLKPDSIDPSDQRSTQARFDGWEQLTKEANPYIAQWLTAIDADSKLTPEQKDEAKKLVWQNSSIRHVYDNTGLKLKTIKPKSDRKITTDINLLRILDASGDETYFYYDQERRPIISIDPTGAIVETTLNNFGNPTAIRCYKEWFPKDKIASLTGGFLNEALRKQFNELQKEGQDAVHTLVPDQRGQIEKETDAEQNVTLRKFNTFKECEQETLPVAPGKSITVDHGFNTRGLEEKTTKSGGDLSTTVERQFESPYDHVTQITDENKGVTDIKEDLLGRPTEITDPTQATRKMDNDAFDRVTKETDALGETTGHLYDQEKRSHLTVYPVEGVTSLEVANVFGQVQSKAEGSAKPKKWKYAPGGEVGEYTNALGERTQDEFDLLGQHTQHVDPLKVSFNFGYDGAGHKSEEVQDAEGLKLKTSRVRQDGRGSQIVEIDPKKIAHLHESDRLERETRTTLDPDPKTLTFSQTLLLEREIKKVTEDPLSCVKASSVQPSEVLAEDKERLISLQDQLAHCVAKRDVQIALKNSDKVENLDDWIVQLVDINNTIGRLKKEIAALQCARLREKSQQEILSLAQGQQEALKETETEKETKQETQTFSLLQKASEIRVEPKSAMPSSKLRSAIDPELQTKVAAATPSPEEKTSVPSAPLQLLTQTTYNGLGMPRSVMRGDVATPDQSLVDLTVDPLNRPNGKIVDPITDSRPDGLALTTVNTLDGKGNVIASKDPNGQITHAFYELGDKRLKRFVVDPDGGVQEWVYDKEGRLICTREYDVAIELPLDANLQTMIAWGKEHASLQDTATWIFRDEKGRERFQITNLGAVIEKRYDGASREIQTIRYDQRVDPRQLPALTTAQLIQEMAQKVSAADRITYRIFDDEGQERFVIDPEKAICEKRYRAGKIIAEIAYANPVEDPVKIATLKEDEVLAALNLDPKRDRPTYHVFDSVGRPWFTVTPAGEETLLGAVTRFTHDDNGNLTEVCQFANPLVIPGDYDALVTLLKPLIPDPAVDRISRREYNTANRTVKITDALGHSDIFDLDALGNTATHTDRAHHLWQFKHDRAERLKTEISPATKITQVREDPKDPSKLTAIELPGAKVVKENTYDKAGNKEKITESLLIPEGAPSLSLETTPNKALPEMRTMLAHYTACNDLRETEIPGVAIDDPSQAASFNPRPEKTTSVKKATVRNAKKLAVAEHNENGTWSFTIWNAEKRPIYKIDALEGVIHYERDTFGDVIRETRYDQRLELDLSQYIQTGIPQSVLEDALKPHPGVDRNTKFTRDKRGDILLKEQDPVFYYVPGDPPAWGRAAPQTKYRYNTFRDCVYRGKSLLSPEREFTWADEFFWHNRTGKELAKTDPGNYVKHTLRSIFDDPIAITDCATPLAQAPTLEMTLADLDKATVRSPDDRLQLLQYNALGKVSSKTASQVIRQERRYNGKIPYFVDLPPQDLTTSFQYNPLELQIAVTYEDGSAAYTFFDERALKIGQTEVPRQSQDVSGQTVTRVPLTHFGVNTAGQTVMEVRFKQGTKPVDPLHPEDLPQPLAADPEDQQKLTLYDLRGLAIARQDAEENVTGYTFSPTRQLAREWGYLTHWQVAQIEKDAQASEQKLESKETKASTLTLQEAKFVAAEQKDSQALQTETKPFLSSSSGLSFTPIPGSSKVKDPGDDDDLPSLLDEDTNESKTSGMDDLPPLLEEGWEQKDQAIFTKAFHLDEKRYGFDLLDRPESTTYLRNNQAVQTIMTGFNTFGDPVAEGPGDGTWPVYRRFDTSGREWASNAEKGVDKIKLYNVTGPETATLQSATRPLCDVSYSELETLPTWSISDLERTQFTRDPRGLTRVRSMPAYEEPDPRFGKPLPIPIQARSMFHGISSGTCLTWIHPILTVGETTFTRWPKGRPELKQTLKVLRSGKYQGVDLGDLSAGAYEYEMNHYMVNPRTEKPEQYPVYTTRGSFQSQAEETKDDVEVTVVALQELSHTIVRPQVTVTPTHKLKYDAWRNETEHEDSLGHLTKTTYMDKDHPKTRTLPKVSVTYPDGHVEEKEPEMSFAYNVRDFALGSTDGNGNAQGQELDAAGQTVRIIWADGTISQSYESDTLGRVMHRWNARQEVWSQEFDCLDHVTATTSPLDRTTSYGYSERGKRNRETNPAGFSEHYNFSVQDDISEHYEALGQCTSSTHDHNHVLKSKKTSGGPTQTWDLDYWGRPQHHVDLGGASYTYGRDLKGQLTKQVTVGGDHGTTLEVAEVLGEYWPYAYPTTAQDLTYTWVAGRLVKVEDQSKGLLDSPRDKVVTYRLDSEGRRIEFDLTQSGTLLHSTQTRLDSHGRDSWTFDQRMTLETEYDAVGNRMHLKGSIPSAINPLIQDQRNLFGKNNEILIDGGELVDGTTQITTRQGTSIGYDADLRKTQLTYIEGIGWVTSTLEYDLEDRLLKTTASEGDYSLRIYDVAGWQRHTEDGTLSAGPYQTHDLVCDANGWPLIETSATQIGGEHPATSHTTYIGHTGEGLVTLQQVLTTFPDSDRTLTDTLTNHYAGFDSWQLEEVGGTRVDSTEEEPEDYSSQNAFYDPYGVLSGRFGTTNSDYFSVFDSTPDGLILRGRVVSFIPFPQPFPLIGERHYFHNVNGQYLASYDFSGGALPIPLDINLDYGRYAVGPLGGCEITAIPDPDKDHPRSHTATMTFPPPMPDSCETQSGDTYETIAGRVAEILRLQLRLSKRMVKCLWILEAVRRFVFRNLSPHTMRRE